MGEEEIFHTKQERKGLGPTSTRIYCFGDVGEYAGPGDVGL